MDGGIKEFSLLDAAVRDSLVNCAVIVDLESRNRALCEDANDESNPIR